MKKIKGENKIVKDDAAVSIALPEFRAAANFLDERRAGVRACGSGGQRGGRRGRMEIRRRINTRKA
jgi:hypothetical protein